MGSRLRRRVPKSGVKVSPVLDNLLGDLRAGRFRPRAIRRFCGQGLRHAIDLAWSLKSLRRSFYAASAFMFAVLAAIGAAMELLLPEGIGPGTWIVEAGLFAVTFFATLAQLGLVRAEESGEVYDRFVFPNVLTLLRLLVLPYVVAGLTASGPAEATAPLGFGLVAAAVVTDTLDGTLARVLGRASDFGRIYDPVVDFLFHSVVAIALYHAGDVSVLYLVVVLVRYLLPPVAGSFLYLFREPFEVKSTIMGKVSSLVLSVFVCACTASRVFPDFPLLGWAAESLEWGSIAACAFTTLFFLGRGITIMTGAKRRKGK
jgi:phosphatidylglycerophosphate synthase